MQRATASQRYSEAYTSLSSAQKSGHAVPAYTRFVNRPLGRRLAAVADVGGLTPAAVTGLSMAASFLGMLVLCLVPPLPVVGFVVGFLMLLGYALDSADGQLARLQGRSGPAGEWLDHVSDQARQTALHGAVLIYLYRSIEDLPRPFLVVPLVYVVAVSTRFLSQILADQLRRSGAVPAVQEDHGGGSSARTLLQLPSDPGVLCLVFLLAGWPETFLAAYGLLMLANVVLTGASLVRRYAELMSAAR